MAIHTVPDHVAIAVPDIDRAAERWHDRLGGGWLSDSAEQLPTPVAIRQLRYANGGKLELLQPTGPGFGRSFLERFGPRIHHVTLKVPGGLLPAVEEMRAHGYDVVDVHAEGGWHEAFLRPSQVGGLIVQLAWEAMSEEEWIAETGYRPEPPRGEAALHGPTLTHVDLDAAQRVWTTLGGEVAREQDALDVTWPGSVFTVRIEAGPGSGPVGLRFTDAPTLPADDQAGPPVLDGTAHGGTTG